MGLKSTGEDKCVSKSVLHCLIKKKIMSVVMKIYEELENMKTTAQKARGINIDYFKSQSCKYTMLRFDSNKFKFAYCN